MSDPLLSEPFRGKTVLVLGGTWQQVKLVEAAKRLGARVVVADYLEDSPAKAISDSAWLVDVKDVDGVVAMSFEEGVDGVVSGYIDPCQRPYQEICEALDLPCYGSREQFHLMTDKRAFKDMCRASGVDVIQDFDEEVVARGEVDFPVFVKPVDSRGSRGQAVCHCRDEFERALRAAKDESSNGKAIVEKCMAGSNEFQVTYFFIKGEPYLIRTADSYTGSERNGLEKVVLGAISPSVFTGEYMRCAHERVVSMLKSMGFRDGPAFMQGFEDDGVFRFFDPGLRFPGVDYERILKSALGIDLPEAMVAFSLTGEMVVPGPIAAAAGLNGGAAAVLFPTISPGIVGDVSSLSRVARMPGVVSCLPRVNSGDVVGVTSDVNQRLAEIDVHVGDPSELSLLVEAVQGAIDVKSEAGDPMLLEILDMAVVRRRMQSLGGGRS